MAGTEFFDFYGNPLSQNPEELRLSGTPLYFQCSSTATPSMTLLEEAETSPWQPLQPLATWKRNKDSVYQEQGGRLHVVTGTTTYGHQLVSAPFPVSPHSRYVFRIDARVLRGMIGWTAMDAATQKRIQPHAWILLLAEGDERPREVELAIQTGDCHSLQMVVAAANSLKPDRDEFEVSNPQFRRCP